ncbi:MAG: 1-acyl-sn-glycerol-3-phosphate acyltransferase [Devosiaceae bacterium]|nr:1-acyl-sn-glycerol-3-phosphate acyltransferase [Devosiaceae bacterium]
MIIQAIRSIIFYIFFILNTAIVAIILGTLSLFKKRGWYRFGWVIAQYWGYSTLFFLRFIVGIKTIILGEENIPKGGCIIGSKHQSDWDIFAIFPKVGRPSFIAKKILLDIPFFGWAARDFDTISVNRKMKSKAIPEMNRQAKEAIKNGCKIIIFPEGTRKAPLAENDYRYGIAKMYQELDVPVVPVALNSGLFWARNALVLWPGTATARFLPPIPKGLEPDEMHAMLKETIEKHTNELILEAEKQGLSAPISKEFREKLDLLKQDLSS